MEMAKDDITKIETIITYPLIAVLNHLSYITDVNEIKRREELKQLARAKSR